MPCDGAWAEAQVDLFRHWAKAATELNYFTVEPMTSTLVVTGLR